MAKEFKYEVVADLGEIGTSGAWHKHLKLIKWNDGEAKYDIRPWSEDGEKMGKGITLTTDELKALVELVSKEGI